MMFSINLTPFWLAMLWEVSKSFKLSKQLFIAFSEFELPREQFEPILRLRTTSNWKSVAVLGGEEVGPL